MPRFIEADPRNTGSNEWFAVVNDTSKTEITNYATNGTSSYFTPSGESSPVIFNNIVTTLMTDMSQIFFNVQTFNDDISSWNTSNVTNMIRMFYGATAFNQPLNTWDTAKVTDMSFMFYFATAFNQNLSGWNVALTPARPSLNRIGFADGSPLALPENSNKLPPFES